MVSMKGFSLTPRQRNAMRNTMNINFKTKSQNGNDLPLKLQQTNCYRDDKFLSLISALKTVIYGYFLKKFII